MCLLQWGPILDVLAAVGAHSRCACCNGGPILDVLAAVGVPF